jgi:hypothetical protein
MGGIRSTTGWLRCDDLHYNQIEMASGHNLDIFIGFDTNRRLEVGVEDCMRIRLWPSNISFHNFKTNTIE